MRSIKRPAVPAFAALLAALAVAALGCGGTSESSGASGEDGGTKLALVSYSTPQEAYEQLIPAFQKTSAGEGVRFTTSFGASGEQSRAVQAGLPADVVALSLAPDVTKLVEKGLVAADWDQGEEKGNVTDSVVVFAVRKGNPKHVRTWDDVVKPGVEVVTPNPFTSGGARWNIMAAYGAQLKQGRSPAEAQAYLAKLLRSTVVQDKSARESLQTFAAGKGDVLLAYENEALTAQAKGIDLDYVIPDQTILIENPIAVTTDSEAPEQAKAFVDYLRTEPAQEIFAAKGYRPVVKAVLDESRYPTPPDLFRIADVGGWPDVTKRFFDPEGSIVADIEQKLGVSTAK